MSILDRAKPVSEVSTGNLWVIYGKSGSGKTTLCSTFPKPALVLQIGDEGVRSIRDVEGVDYVSIESLDELKEAMLELRNDTKYESVFLDTFSLAASDWIISKGSGGKGIQIQDWGVLMFDTLNIISMAADLSRKKQAVVLTCYENNQTVDDVEGNQTNYVMPNVRDNILQYLLGVANIGLHMGVVSRTIDDKTETRFVAHIGDNPFYWVKRQMPARVIPSSIVNPTYDKITALFNKETSK